MQIQLKNIGKRFGSSSSGWIFRDVNQQFELGKAYALTGNNGSGKSTLLKIISGGLTPTIGAAEFKQNNQIIEWGEAAKLINYAAPYVDLIEHLTLEEHLKFHFQFKHFLEGMIIESVISSIEMQADRSKLIKDFSSGMKQRLKLALSLYTENPILLLDEPTANLDKKWSDWYLDQILKLKSKRLIVIASNDKLEYEFCDEVVSVLDYK